MNLTDPNGTDILDTVENAWDDVTDEIDNFSPEEVGQIFLAAAGTAGLCRLAAGAAAVPGAGWGVAVGGAVVCASASAGTYYSFQQARQSEE